MTQKQQTQTHPSLLQVYSFPVCLTLTNTLTFSASLSSSLCLMCVPVCVSERVYGGVARAPTHTRTGIIPVHTTPIHPHTHPVTHAYPHPHPCALRSTNVQQRKKCTSLYTYTPTLTHLPTPVTHGQKCKSQKKDSRISVSVSCGNRSLMTQRQDNQLSPAPQ